ncbi:MAG: DNA-directed RNA polymerase subunit omega [Oscillospiraceae bacterium]
MMLYPPMANLIDKVGSRYLLVNLVAKRARKIAAEAEENGEPLDEKPVSEAIDEVYSGKLIVTEHTGPEAAEPEAAEPAPENPEETTEE